MFSALASLAGSLGGGAMELGGSAYATRKADQANRRNLATQRLFAKKAHQWEVKDLKKAGLNPILSAGGAGASASGGSSLAIPSPTSGVADAMTSAYKTYNTERKLANSQIALNKKLANQAVSTAKNQNAQARNQNAQAKNTENMEPKSGAIGSTWNLIRNVPSATARDVRASSLRVPRTWKQAKENFRSHWK